MIGAISGLVSRCFVEGTIVKTEDGDRNIEDIQEGDRVWSCNPDTGEVGLKEVKQVFINETEELEHLLLTKETDNITKSYDKADSHDTTDPEIDSEEYKNDCTPNHPFYVVDYGFKYASELSIGDRVISLDGDIYREGAVTREVIRYTVHLSDFVSPDDDLRLLFQSVQVSKRAMEGIGGREDVHTFQNIKTVEENEQADGCQYTNFYFAGIVLGCL